MKMGMTIVIALLIAAAPIVDGSYTRKSASTLDKAVTFIAQIEKFTAKAYFDRAQYTNGYGTKALHKGEIVTPLVAKERLKKNVVDHYNHISRLKGLNSNQKIALTSFSYNIGKTAFIKSSVYKNVKCGKIKAAMKSLNGYIFQSGKKLSGLIERREKEIKLFLSK